MARAELAPNASTTVKAASAAKRERRKLGLAAMLTSWGRVGEAKPFLVATSTSDDRRVSPGCNGASLSAVGAASKHRAGTGADPATPAFAAGF